MITSDLEENVKDYERNKVLAFELKTLVDRANAVMTQLRQDKSVMVDADTFNNCGTSTFIVRIKQDLL